MATHFNLLANTLSDNEKARRQWIADISHELRTPLAILQGEIEALQDGIRSTTPEGLRSLHSEIIALAKLVDDLHDLSLSDLGAMDYRREPVNLTEIMEEVCCTFQQRFSSRGMALRNQISSHSQLPVFGDADRLIQLFSNLLENSIRYTDSPGFCEITAEKTKQAVRVNFRDSAPGVPEDALGRLFERLYRVDTSRSREFGGSGLGLAICQNIIKAHGGSISAQPCEYGGLWISLVFPLSIA